MLHMCLYFAPDRNIMLIVIRPFDEILGVFRLSLAKLVEKLLRCHPVSSFKDAETLSYSYKSVYRRIILNSLFPHISTLPLISPGVFFPRSVRSKSASKLTRVNVYFSAATY